MIARALTGKILVFAVFFVGIITGMLIINFYETRVAGSPPDTSDRRGRSSELQRDVNRVHDYLGLDEAQVLDAFSLTLCQATRSAELKYSPHSVIRAVRDAFAAKAGVLSALLARKGVKGFDLPFEGKAGAVLRLPCFRLEAYAGR